MTDRRDIEEEDDDKKTYAIECSLCGSEAEVPFRPRKGQDVFCPDCYRYKKKSVQKRRENFSPRKRHGTRVSFPIECVQCGEEEVLDYVPKGIKLDEALCSQCVRTTYGDESRWAQIKETKQKEQKHEWKIVCVDCGREDYLNFPPKPDKDYRCVRCFNLHEQPSPERLEGRKRVGRTVYIRKSDEEGDGEDDSS
jgi:CxxC-x17-CxxC domain-containing protein